MRLRRRKALHETVELNITAFLNLMVILVPFLLITAVFSRIVVLELNLPALTSAEGEEEKIDLQLQILVYPEQLIIQDANIGPIQSFTRQDGVIDWPPVVDVLVEIKRRFPTKRSVSLLLDPRVPYQTLIHVMDHVHSTEMVNVGTLELVELFPDISIGDAPALDSVAEGAGTLDDLPGQEEEVVP